MGFFKEFKEFAMKGNVMDMAVGVIIGGAFGKIVSSLVNDILMPPIGALLGKNEEAETVIDGMKTTFESLKGVCGDGEKTIYFEVSPLEYGLWTAGANTFMNEIAELLGLKNCFADVEGWAEISEEQVLERNPDYIMTISMYSGEGPTPEEEIASRAGWENVTAVKNGAILNLQNNELSRPAPRLAEGAQMLADFIAGVEANDKAA